MQFILSKHYYGLKIEPVWYIIQYSKHGDGRLNIVSDKTIIIYNTHETFLLKYNGIIKTIGIYLKNRETHCRVVGVKYLYAPHKSLFK